jgi:hydrogenase maturation protease
MSDAIKAPVAVIGVGNPDRGDDALGSEFVSRFGAWLALQGRGHATREVALLTSRGEPSALWNEWEPYGHVVLVDALSSARHPAGTVLRLTAAELCRSPADEDGAGAAEEGGARPFSTHGLGLLEAVRLGRELGKLPPRLDVVGVVGASFAPLSPLSSEVTAALPALMREVEAIIQSEWNELGHGEASTDA